MPRKYLVDDSHYEIVFKNKHNIIELLAQIDNIPSDTEFKTLVDLVGNYDQDVADDLDESKSVIENLSIVASNLKASLLRIDTLERQVNNIINDGTGKYIGTYLGADADDSSNLPSPSQENDRAIVLFIDNDDEKYQEYSFTNNAWVKIGDVLDSHIHQSSAEFITISQNGTEHRIYADGKVETYVNGVKVMDDEVVFKSKIADSLPKWTEVQDLWTNPNKFDKYKDKDIRITLLNNGFQATELLLISNGVEPDQIYFSGSVFGYWLDKSLSPRIHDITSDMLILYDDVNKREFNQLAISKVEVK